MRALRIVALIAFALCAIVLQATLPLYVNYLTVLDLPLLMVIYFALAFRSSGVGTLAGAFIGLAKDTLSRDILGICAIADTVVGYVTSLLSERMDMENSGVRAIVIFVLFWLQSGCVYLLESFLLGQTMPLEAGRSAVAAVVNAFAGVIVFKVLDRFKTPA